MKSLSSLWCVMATEVGRQCGVSTQRDCKTVTLRVKDEGLSFLTITLPTFASELQKALADGVVGRDLFPFFRKRGRTPLFLGDLLDRVFDRVSGRLLDEPDIDCLRGIRQLSLLFSKIEIPCSDARVTKAMSKFVECESDVRQQDATRSRLNVLDFERLSLLLFGDIMNRVDLAIYEGSLIPKHGPGATADRLRGNSKFDLRSWTSRLEEHFPYGDYALPNWRFNYRLNSVNICEPGAEKPVRVIPVPKTLKTPRIIAIEPTCMQYVQQAISSELVTQLESSWFAPMIGFYDQDPNRVMAEQGSRDGSLATLDLSEASDRVSNQLVRSMFRFHPNLLGGVDSCRSRKADVPGHGVIRLAKFASMGSALCFPVEAMVFLTVVFVGIERGLNRPVSRSDILSLRGLVRVYGDDIVVPTDFAKHVIGALEDFGLLVNADKSFWTGKFRESCGKEYYDGHDVSVVKCRRLIPTRRGDVPGVLSLSSLRNQLYWSGWWDTCEWLDRKILRLLEGKYPYVDVASPGLGRNSVLGYDTQKQDPALHRPLVKAYVPTSQPPISRLSGVGALLKCLLKKGDEPLALQHLERSGRPEAVRIKLRWAPPY